MTDANDLEARIRRAREWADQQKSHHERRAKQGVRGAAAEAATALAYSAIVNVLDQITQPTNVDTTQSSSSDQEHG